MKVFEIAALVASVINLAFAIFVFRQDLRSRLHKYYLLWGVGVAFWNISVFVDYRTESPIMALFWVKLLQFGIIIAPVGLFLLCYHIVNHPVPRWFRNTIYIIHGLFGLSLIGDWFVKDVRYVSPYGYWCVPGPLFWLYLVSYVFLTVMPMVQLYLAQRQAQGLQRTRLQSILVAVAAIWVAGTNDLLPILQVTRYPFTSIPFYPLGPVAAVLHVTIVSYSTLQHQLLDVHVILGRIAAHLLRLFFWLLMALCLMLLITSVFPKDITGFGLILTMGVFGVSAAVGTVIFPRLFGKGEEWLERRILGDRFEYQDRVVSSIQIIRSITDTRVLQEQFDELLTKTMGIRRYHVILLDDTTRNFYQWDADSAAGGSSLVRLELDSPILKLFRVERPPYLAFKFAYAPLGSSGLESESRKLFPEIDPEFCFPFYDGENPFGLLFLAGKLNGDSYTRQDLKLIEELVQGLSIVLNQIRLNRQVQQAKEMELLGYMSAGLAHDLNNLLTPVRTFQQFFAAGMPKSDAILELLPVAMRNLDTVQSYIREALFFSRTQSLNLKQTPLDQVIQSAIKLVEPAAKEKQVKVEFVPADREADVEMDDVLILRLIGNLLSNAVDASPSGSVVQAVLLSLPRTEISRDWYRVQVVDKGEGISKENLKRIMMPYFSTKNQGDGKRGFGLGLAIARKIVHLHHGNLYIASEERKGTTVQVDLPSKQNTKPAPLKTPALVPG